MAGRVISDTPTLPPITDVRLHNSLTFHYPAAHDTPEAALPLCPTCLGRHSGEHPRMPQPTYDTPEAATIESYIYRLPEIAPDPRIIVTGYVTVREREIEVSGWTVEEMTLPELAEYAARWAEDRLDEI
jgi:hypothetical protein